MSWGGEGSEEIRLLKQDKRFSCLFILNRYCSRLELSFLQVPHSGAFHWKQENSIHEFKKRKWWRPVCFSFKANPFLLLLFNPDWRMLGYTSVESSDLARGLVTQGVVNRLSENNSLRPDSIASGSSINVSVTFYHDLSEMCLSATTRT